MPRAEGTTTTTTRRRRRRRALPAVKGRGRARAGAGARLGGGVSEIFSAKYSNRSGWTLSELVTYRSMHLSEVGLPVCLQVIMTIACSDFATTEVTRRPPSVAALSWRT